MNLPTCFPSLRTSLRRLGIALLIFVCAGSALAFPRPTIYGQIANTHIEDTVIFWDQFNLEYRRVTVHVTAPCGDFSRVFKSGETPFFDVAELGSEVDGAYTYDLVAEPVIDPEVEDQLQSVRGTSEEQEVVQSLWDKGMLPRGPFRQSGFFEVTRGLIVTQDGKEESAKLVTPNSGLEARSPGSTENVAGTGEGIRNLSAAQTIAQSLCVGFDCPSSPTFDDTTILMMENNTRIKFDDTSTASSFPRNDWEIEANSRSNGGGSYFAIQDCGQSSQGGCVDDPLFLIEAGAPSNSIRVDNGGRVGLGTANPVVELQVVDGDTPTLRLEQDGSSGFAPQVWDIAGNETSFFIRDATNGSTLPFRIRPGADSNSLVIDTDNDVGVGTLSPSEALHVRRTDGSAQVLVEETSGTVATRSLLQLLNNGGAGLSLENSNSGQEWRIDTGGADFNITLVGTGELVELDPSGNLTVSGNLVTGGGGTCDPGPCDRTFSPDYEVESIEEHAAYMWENQHLWGVGPTPEGAPINLSKKTTGILHELEKAHIYIEELHTTIQKMEARLSAIEENP